VFENSLLIIIYGRKSDEVKGLWIKLQNEELTDLYSQSNIIRLIKSKRIRVDGHIASMGGDVSTGFCWLTLRERDHMEETGLYGK